MKKELIRKYARLIARIGANIEAGEAVVIHSDVEIHEFITLLTEECYLAGASEVRVEWGSDALTRLHYEHRTLESLTSFPAWQTAKMRERAEKMPTRIHVISEAPDALAGIDRAKYKVLSEDAICYARERGTDAVGTLCERTTSDAPSIIC